MSGVPLALRPGEAGSRHLHEPESSSSSSPVSPSGMIGLISFGSSPVIAATSIAVAMAFAPSLHSVWYRKLDPRMSSGCVSSQLTDYLLKNSMSNIMKQDTNSLWEKLSRYGDSFTPRPFVEIVKGKVKESSSKVVRGKQIAVIDILV